MKTLQQRVEKFLTTTAKTEIQYQDGKRVARKAEPMPPELLEAHGLIIELSDELQKQKIATGLTDTLGNEILVGNIVHWTDGGDKLTLAERIATRWDRIAVVLKQPDIQFEVIDSPHRETAERGHTFNYGNFIYKDSQKYLTVVANDAVEYRNKFKNAGECMAWVLNARAQHEISS